MHFWLRSHHFQRVFSPLRSTCTALAVALPALVMSVASPAANAADEVFGPNVYVFDPSMETSEIQAIFDRIWEQQRDDEMGGNRYALMFKPGTYGSASEPLFGRVGYYTEVLGLGASPNDVRIIGKVESFNRCFDADGEPADIGDPDLTDCFALNNFWRSMANLTIEVNGTGQDGCTASANFWAVSQAASMRRVQIIGGNLSLMDYCSPGTQFASGGFIADTKAGTLINGSQQQWYTRDSNVDNWTNPVWNQVFTGVVGNKSFEDQPVADDSGYPVPPYTIIDETPVSREKPFLFVNGSGDYFVRVADAQFNTRGISWQNGFPPGRSISLDDFFIATPDNSVREIRRAVKSGKHLLFTPGVYDVNRSININNANTVVLGLGHATLLAVQGATPLQIRHKPGIVVAGMTIDAGLQRSKILLQVGQDEKTGKSQNRIDPNNPITLSDVYFRVGGPYIGKTRTALEINSNHVLVDHTWVWRADHGIEPFNLNNGFLGDNERWRQNIGRFGVIVNGDDVTATGLFVEHFQRYNTLWRGERGRVYLYQCELPYDPPNQRAWRRNNGTLGWAGYKVANKVRVHNLWGGGVYAFNRNDPSIVTENGFEVPNRPGISLVHVMTNNLSGPGTINSVVNGVGATVDGIPDPGDADNAEDPSYVVSYP